jgi:hypothetical protein
MDIHTFLFLFFIDGINNNVSSGENLPERAKESKPCGEADRRSGQEVSTSAQGHPQEAIFGQY